MIDFPAFDGGPDAHDLASDGAGQEQVFPSGFQQLLFWANLEKKVPLSWMNENHTQMTEDFLAYARPLIQAELTPLYIAGLPHHIYMKPQK